MSSGGRVDIDGRRASSSCCCICSFDEVSELEKYREGRDGVFILICLGEFAAESMIEPVRYDNNINMLLLQWKW